MNAHHLTPLEQRLYTIDRMAWECRARNPYDDQRAVALIRWAESEGLRGVAVTAIVAARAQHKLWYVRTQRSWQTRESRRPSRGRHHDSWSIREKYVRCHDNPLEKP